MEHVQTSWQPTTRTRGLHTHIHPYATHTHTFLRVPEIKGRYFGRCATCFKVWRVREWGYQEMCPVVQATYVGFTAAHHCTLPIPTILCHTPTMHRGVKAHVHRGRWGAWLASPSWGNVPPSPLPCSCLHRGQLVGSVSVHTDHPYFVWQTHKKYGAQQ